MSGHGDEKPPVEDRYDATKRETHNRHDSLASTVTAGDDHSDSGSLASSAHQNNPPRDVEKVEATEIDDGAAEAEGSKANQDTEAQVRPGEVEQLPPAISKPRHERRGLFARLCLVPEVDEPKHYERRTKWFITAVVALASIAAPVGSNILLSSLVEVSQDLNSSPTITNLSIALYVFSLGVFPIFWSSFSEVLGRRSVYVISFGILTLFNVLSAVSVNIGMFLVMRILSGGASGSVQAVGAGTIADVWHVRERGNAMAMYYLGPLMGPLFAPIIGGALQIRFGWRSTMWFNSIYGVVMFLLLLFCLPETIAKRKKFGVAEEAAPPTPVAETEVQSLHASLQRVTSRQSIKHHGRLVLRVLNGLFIQPLAIVQYLQFPAVLLTIYYASVTFGCLYMLQISIQNTFSKPPYNFSTLDVGLTYIPASIGYASCALFAGKWTDHVMAREARRAKRYDAQGRLAYIPEDRMKENVWAAVVLYPAALIWWGWSAEKEVFWLVPCLANFFFGVGSMLVFSTVTTMLTEFMPHKAASAIGLNNLCRMVTAGVGICVTQPLLDAIGTGWLFTAIALIALLSSVSIWAMSYYGPRWRVTMTQRLEEKRI